MAWVGVEGGPSGHSAPTVLSCAELKQLDAMSWVTIIWAMIASSCLTLALVHVLVW